jgi:hypothetical protein
MNNKILNFKKSQVKCNVYIHLLFITADDCSWEINMNNTHTRVALAPYHLPYSFINVQFQRNCFTFRTYLFIQHSCSSYVCVVINTIKLLNLTVLNRNIILVKVNVIILVNIFMGVSKRWKDRLHIYSSTAVCIVWLLTFAILKCTTDVCHIRFYSLNVYLLSETYFRKTW